MERGNFHNIQTAAEAWLTESRKSLASRTVLRRAASLNSFAKFAELDISLQDYKLPPTPPPDPHPLPNLLNDIDRMIVAASNPLQRGLVALGGLAGLRVSETISLKPEDISLEEKKITVIGKGEKLRKIPISRRLWTEMLPLYVAAKAQGTRLIPLEDRNARAIITAIGKRAGISRPVSSHDLRATFATVIYNRTKDIHLVQNLLGHSSVETTTAYLGINNKTAREAVEF